MKKILYVSFLLALVGFSSCIKKSDVGVHCNYDECGLVVSAAETQTVEDYISTNNITGAVKHCSGMYYKVITEGTGVSPTACSAIAFTYKGYLTNGTVFDESSSAVQYSLNALIRGWVNALPHIKSGGRIVMYIPPTLGYGAQPVGDPSSPKYIPANSMLIFEVDLLGVQ